MAIGGITGAAPPQSVTGKIVPNSDHDQCSCGGPWSRFYGLCGSLVQRIWRQSKALDDIQRDMELQFVWVLGTFAPGRGSTDEEQRRAMAADIDAAQRVIDFVLGWLFDPVVFVKYPGSVRRLVGSRLSEFTADQAGDLIGLFDFIGMYHYTANSVTNYPYTKSFIYNPEAQAICYRDEENNENLTMWESLYDIQRVTYYKQHLEATKQAILQGADIRGYYAWSFTDNLEWSSGFNSRFGLK
ncbi:hypothetical protein ACH5RR_009009 [Cinchona calisaya]|uniref:Beta-glucosidase n=1 Tax=Cinchona calisaya TaxID=153742 RepID=A0ABD3AG02_9GENT